MNKRLYEKLQGYFDGEATLEERHVMESILAESEECRVLLEKWSEQRRVLSHLKPKTGADNSFVTCVMNRLEELRPQTAEPIELPNFLRWLFPTLGYAFSAILVFLTLSFRQPLVNADTILLSVMPEETHSVFMARKTDVSQIFDTEEMR